MLWFLIANCVIFVFIVLAFVLYGISQKYSAKKDEKANIEEQKTELQLIVNKKQEGVKSKDTHKRKIKLSYNIGKIGINITLDERELKNLASIINCRKIKKLSCDASTLNTLKHFKVYKRQKGMLCVIENESENTAVTDDKAIESPIPQ